MIFRLFSDRDTYISNAKWRSVPQTASNFGAAETLELFKLAGVSGALGAAATASCSRLLVRFDLTPIAELTASGKAPSTGLSYFLKLEDVPHNQTVPTSYDIHVFPLSTSWDEGVGLDTVDYQDRGFANWEKSTRSTYWTTNGGDYLSAPSASVHFDTGFEDVAVDVTETVNSWLTGGLENNGFLIKLSGTLETDWTDYFVKKFYGRSSTYVDRRPCIEVRWDDSLRDDRSTFKFDQTGSLFMYRQFGGQFTDVSAGTILVTIADSSGNLLTVTGSSAGVTGVYSASFAIPTGSYSGSVFYDKWGSGSYAFLTGTFSPVREDSAQVIAIEQYTVKVKNLKNEYTTDDEVRFAVFVRTNTYSPAVVSTASVDVSPHIVKKVFWKIDNEVNGDEVFPFGTGSLQETRMSYDSNGNYFKFHMRNLVVGNLYRMSFLVDESGQRQVIGPFRFKVV